MAGVSILEDETEDSEIPINMGENNQNAIIYSSSSGSLSMNSEDEEGEALLKTSENKSNNSTSIPSGSRSKRGLRSSLTSQTGKMRDSFHSMKKLGKDIMLTPKKNRQKSKALVGIVLDDSDDASMNSSLFSEAEGGDMDQDEFANDGLMDSAHSKQQQQPQPQPLPFSKMFGHRQGSLHSMDSGALSSSHQHQHQHQQQDFGCSQFEPALEMSLRSNEFNGSFSNRSGLTTETNSHTTNATASNNSNHIQSMLLEAALGTIANAEVNPLQEEGVGEAGTTTLQSSSKARRKRPGTKKKKSKNASNASTTSSIKNTSGSKVPKPKESLSSSERSSSTKTLSRDESFRRKPIKKSFSNGGTTTKKGKDGSFKKKPPTKSKSFATANNKSTTKEEEGGNGGSPRKPKKKKVVVEGGDDDEIACATTKKKTKKKKKVVKKEDEEDDDDNVSKASTKARKKKKRTIKKEKSKRSVAKEEAANPPLEGGQVHG
ncbi:MAG: hypothetical protein SGBAC_011840 [Bacillariaceae sp.]